jgi:hypothetical protein
MDGGKGGFERQPPWVKVPAREVADDPQWLPHSYDPAGFELVSVRLPREAQRDLPFLWDEHFGGAFPKTSHPAGALRGLVAAGPGRPLHFVFHSAFCGSTLLMRALAAAAPIAALKEPAIFNNLTHRIERGGEAAERERTGVVLALLARGFEGDRGVVVKPTNFATRIALPLLRARPTAKAILLYSDLPGFLYAVARRGVGGRTWGRRLYASYAAATPVDFGYAPGELYEQTDLQAAALGWMLQMWHLRAVLRQSGAGRTRVLAWSDLLSRPAETLACALTFFGLEAERARAECVAAGEIFSRHSKDPARRYGAADEEARAAAAASAYGEEVDLVVKWAAAVAAHAGLPPPAAPL